MRKNQNDADHDATETAKHAADARARHDDLELNMEYLAAFRCGACFKRFYLPSHNCADDIIAGLCCPRCGNKDMLTRSGWCRLVKTQPQTLTASAPIQTPARR